MASAIATAKISANVKIQMWDHDPGTTNALVLSPDGGTTDRIFDMSGYEAFACLAMSSTLTGNGITKLEIVAASDSALSTDVTVIKDSGTVAADAVGDYVFEECTAEELAQLSSAGSIDPPLRYVAPRLTVQNSADEAVVTTILYKPKFATSGLTADTIA